MPHPKHLTASEFTYHLPEDKIALYPLEQRDASRLLIFKNGHISENIFTHIAEYLPANSLLVFNNTRVIPARLLFQKNTGSVIEIFILEPAAALTLAGSLEQTGSAGYLCLVKGAAKWKSGVLAKKLHLSSQDILLEAELIEKQRDAFHIRFSWQPASLSFTTILQAFGEMPIPPYLHRPAETADTERYQTIYASHHGSVAAPTAGLHFTEAVMQSLSAKNISTAYTTLHVGAGTFKPVKAATLAGHEMHAEWLNVDRTLLEQLLVQRNIIPVGTTSLRTLESLYWLGLKTLIQPDIEANNLTISQWEVYEEKWPQQIPVTEAIEALLKWMNRNNSSSFLTQTQILIAPGYNFQLCKGLITNFHQPQSTLLLLIAALIGDKWKDVYDYALKNNFRFLSYGDSSYLVKSEQFTMNNRKGNSD